MGELGVIIQCRILALSVNFFCLCLHWVQNSSCFLRFKGFKKRKDLLLEISNKSAKVSCTFQSLAFSRSLFSFLVIPLAKAWNPKTWMQEIIEEEALNTRSFTQTVERHEWFNNNFQPASELSELWLSLWSLNNFPQLSHHQMISQTFHLYFHIRSISSWWNNDHNCGSSRDC